MPSILARRDRMSLENGLELRLLSALEAMEARREGLELAEDGLERALCSNACLLARALEGCCPACGQSLPEEETGNPTFDLERFEALKEGKGLD